MIKNLLAVQETWVRFLGQKDPLEDEMTTHSSILAWRIPWTGAWQAKSMGSHTHARTHTHTQIYMFCCGVLSHSVLSDSFATPWTVAKDVGCHALLQGVFQAQVLDTGLPHCRRILYPLSHQGSPYMYTHTHTHI